MGRPPRKAPRAASPRRAPTTPAAGTTPSFRVGIGADVHPLGLGRRLVLGGVEIRHDRGLAGHSDADVLAHAVCDAVLGALGLPDMGSRFPETDERYRGASSLRFVEEAAAEARGHGFEIVNVDAVILAEAPRLQPHLAAMGENLARALGCEASRVSVKVKRPEGLGAIGRREGMMAQAVTLLAAPGGRQGRT